MLTNQEIHDQILKYMHESGVALTNWYIGIAKFPKTRLFYDHNVKESGFWIYQDAGTNENARTIGKMIMEKHNTQGNIDGGDEFTSFVYAYAITQKTKQ